MPELPGVFIVLEGADGSGKGTQFKILAERLRAAGHEVEIFDFPRYDKESSHFVKQYLNGAYGPATSVSPYVASMFFALDRYEAGPEIAQALEQGKIVLSNRYVGSNMAHQGAKFSKSAERRGFFMWADNLEYEVLGIPRPTRNLFLKVPAEISFELIKGKARRSYTAESHDEHEADINHLRQSVAAYELLCVLFPKDFKAINCVKAGRIRSIPEISDMIWRELKPLLPEPSHPGHSTTVSLAENPTPKKNEEDDTPAETGSRVELSTYAAMQLLASNPDAHISLLSTKKDHYTPRLPKKAKAAYADYIKSLSQKRRKFISELRVRSGKLPNSQLQHVAYLLMPLAQLHDISLSTGNLSITSNLDELARLDGSSRKAPPLKLKMDASYGSADNNAVELLNASYRNEFDALAELAFSSGSGPMTEIKSATSGLAYKTKQSKLQSLLGTSQGRETMDYDFQITADYRTMLDLAFSGYFEKISLQEPVPRLGYDIPPAVEAANLSEEYSEIFDDVLQAHSQLQPVSDQAAAYTVLAGHLGRFKVRTSAEQLMTIPNKALKSQIIEAIREVNPLTADYIAK